MAISSILLLSAAVALLISPATSLTCATTNFSNCADLPTLNASLHWTYDIAANPSPTLSVAFLAPPASPDGWIGWGLNPSGSGMVGSQSFIAFRDANGTSVVVKTYNITSYGPIAESPISYDVLERRAEFSDGIMRIFATVEVAEEPQEVNQVWQVGAVVRNGVPLKHDFSPDNLRSKGKLQLNRKAPVKVNDAPAAAPVDGGNMEVRAANGYGILVLLMLLLVF